MSTLLALVSCNTGLAEASERWEPFEPRSAGFRILFPGVPTEERESRRTWIGRVRDRRFWLQLPDAELTVEIHEIPRLATALVHPRSILERAEKALLEDAAAREVESKEIAIREHPGRSLAYEVPARPGWLEEALLVLVGRRLYAVLAGRRQSIEGKDVGARFLGSFEVLEDEKDGINRKSSGSEP